MSLESNTRIIWYISKYALSPTFGNPSRQFFFSKYFVKKGVDKVYMISSRSVGTKKMPSMGLRNELQYECEGVRGVLLNGPTIKLGFNIKRLVSWLIFELRLLYWALFKASHKPDVIIVSSLSLLTFVSGAILKKKYKCKLIVEVRDIWPLTLVEIGKWRDDNLLIKFLKFIENIGYNSANAIIGSMPNLKEHVANVSTKVRAEVYCVPMGYDPTYWSHHKHSNFFDSLFAKVREGSFIVGYAGTIGNANCVDQIIAAATLLRNEPITFLILGEGPAKESLEKLTIDMGLSKVHFVAPVPKELVKEFLEGCDLLLNPWKGNNSIYKFGVSPNKWIDYMLSKKPILVPYDGYPSIINESKCGKFIKPDNPMLLAEAILEFSLLDKRMLETMGKNGQDYLLEKLTYDKLSERYLSIISSC